MSDELNLIDTEFEENQEAVIEKFEVTKRDRVFVVLITLASIVLSVLGICKGFNLGFSASLVLLLICIALYFCKGTKKVSIFAIASIVLSFSMSTVFSITTNLSVRFFSVVMIFLLMLCFLSLILRGNFADGDLGILTTIFTPVLKQTFPKLPKTVRSLFTGDPEKKSNFGKIIIGICASIPVLFVVLPLLISSDAAFSGMTSIFTDNVVTIVMKCILGLIIGLLIINYCFVLKKEEITTTESVKMKEIDNTITISFLSVLSICYLAFLFSQLAYFFSAFSGFLPENYEFTLAQYARRGFFELCTIAGINFAIIFATILFSKKADEKICLPLKLICTFISVFTLLITATAMAKMFLYIGEYGMTELRISTSAFMVFLFVTFIALIFRIYIAKIKVIKTAFLTAGIILSLLGIFNINSIIAKYNYTAYKEGWLNQKIDVTEISLLGDEGIPYLAMLSEDENREVALEAETELIYILNKQNYYKVNCEIENNITTYNLGEKNCRNIAEMTFAKKKAYQALEDFVDNNPDALRKAWNYYID